MSLQAHRWMMNAPGGTDDKARPSTPRRRTWRGGGRVAGCGVCHTDLGYYYDGVRKRAAALALGHEVSGRVVAAGAGAEAGWARR